MITLSPILPGYLPGFSDIGTQKWFNYIINLSQDTVFNTTGSTQGNDFGLGADVIYQGVSFSGNLLPLPEGVFPSTATFPTRRKATNNTNYNSGGARTGLFVKANFLLNKSMDAGSNVWGNELTVTIPTEQIIVLAGSNAAITSLVHTCVLKKVSTGGTISTLKTLSLVSTMTNGNRITYTFNSNTAIGAVSAGDILYIEYTATFTGGAHSSTGDREQYSIITNGLDTMFASIP